jgi:hypothetical protein
MLNDTQGGGGHRERTGAAASSSQSIASLQSLLNNISESTTGTLCFAVAVVGLLIAVLIGVFVVVAHVNRLSSHTRVTITSLPTGVSPQLPTDYSPMDMRRARYILTMGDGFANGLGVSNVDRDSWFSMLRKRNMPRAMPLRLASSYATVDDLTAQRDHLAQLYPNGLDGLAVVVIFAGGEDIVSALLESPGAEDDIMPAEVATRVSAFAASLLHNTTLFPNGVFVFTVDYPDPTNGLNYISAAMLQCEAPLEAWLNQPGAFSEAYTRALDLHSAALQAGAIEGNFAHVPLRHVLRRHGYNRAVVLSQSDSSAPRSSVTAVQSDEETGPLFADCVYLNNAGQRHLSDLLWMFINNQPYFQLY